MGEPYLGTYIEHKLKRMGITQDRYRQVKATFGLPPECQCDARRDWLDRVHKWWVE